MATSHASTTELDFSLRQHANSTAHDDKPSGKPGRKPAGQVYEAGARSSRSNPALVRRGLLSVSPDRAYEGRTKPAFAGRGLQPKWPTNASGARLVPAVLGLSFKKRVRFHRVTPALPAPSVPAPSVPAPSMPAPSKRASPLASMSPMPLRKNPAIPWTLLTIKTLAQSLGAPIWLDFTVRKPPDGQK